MGVLAPQSDRVAFGFSATIPGSRDVLMGAGLEYGGWGARPDAEFGVRGGSETGGYQPMGR